MSTILEQWLELAPKPAKLSGDQRWHVFLSYRSVHRPWVIQLYDVLRQLEFEVFLDQYVLAASDTWLLQKTRGCSLTGAFCNAHFLEAAPRPKESTHGEIQKQVLGKLQTLVR